MTEKWVNYITAGYSEDDGLGEGRWMRDQWGVRVWVGELSKPRAQTPGPRKLCVDCSAPVDKRALRCLPHAKKQADRIKREHMRKVRSEEAA